MIGNGTSSLQNGGLSSLLGVPATAQPAASAATSTAASGDGRSFADFAASAAVDSQALVTPPGAPTTGGVMPPSTASLPATSPLTGSLPTTATLPMQTSPMTPLQQQAAVAANAAQAAAALSANAAKLAAATAAQRADAGQTVARDAVASDPLAMLAALSPQAAADATASTTPTPSTDAKPALPANKDTSSDTATAAAPADASLSQQMLNLLAGSLAITAPAQPQQNTTALPTVDTSATGAGSGAAAALMAGNATQLQQSPGLAQTGALAALLDPKAAASVDTPADALKLAMNVALDRDSGDSFVLPDSKDDKTSVFGLGGLTTTAPTLDRPLTANAVTATPMSMPAHLDDGFDDSFGTRIAWMAEQKLGHAEIRLNPENAGPIDVRIQLDGTQVNAAFHSANADVRQALEASLPRLRDMLGQQGLQLGNADIGQRQQSGQQQAQTSSGQSQGFAGSGDTFGNGSASSSASVAPVIVRSRGLLDEYA